MDEIINFSRLLHDTPSLLPWVIFVAVVIVLISQKNRILDYWDARTEAQKERKNSNIIMTELIRNNTAALNNNTAALETVRAERKDIRALIEHHEQMSAERDKHIQEVVNRVDKTVISNAKGIDIIEDRTSK